MLIERYQFPIEHCILPHLLQCHGDRLVVVGDDQATALVKRDALVFDFGHQPKAVPLVLEYPVLAVEGRVDQRRQHGLKLLGDFGRACHRRVLRRRRDRPEALSLRRDSRRHVNVYGFQERAPRVANLVAVARLDQHDRSGFEFVLVAVDGGYPAPFDHVQPLVGSAMEVVWPTFLSTNRQNHHGCLRSGIGDGKTESRSETQEIRFHGLAPLAAL